jgi:ABC-2 type transport system ATP-binding protein
LWALAQTNGISKARVREVLDIVGLTSVATKRAGKFSLGMGQRLGIAGALLGDPGVLLFDEPTNGLDPEGIRWVRNLLKDLAAEGRTVFVSSHLMSEMALTAEHLVVIGRGRLIAEMAVSDFIAQSSRQFVRVRTRQCEVLTRELQATGASVVPEEDGGLAVTGVPAAEIGAVASAFGVVLEELSPQAASLEEAFMELTHDSVEYGASDPSRPAAGSTLDSDRLIPVGK